MESLSIKKTGKVFLAVALVIFMLVALLGLSIYGHTATAAADAADLEISAVFSATSATAHTDSTTTAKYYNQLASGDGALPLAVNDTFTVTYSFTVNSNAFTGAKYLDLTNTGFDIVSVTVGGVNLTTNLTTTTSNGIYTMSADGKSRIGFDGNGALMTAVDNIVVVYKLTSAIDPYSNATLGIKAGKYSVLRKTLQDVTSSTVGVYVRSTAGITTTDPSKTYDATAATTSTTFTPAVSDTGNESRRSEIVTTWSSGSAPIDAGNYNVAVATAANDYYEATAYNTNFTISPKAITITAVDKTSVYSTTPVALSYTASPIDFYDRDSVTVTYTGAGASISTATTVGNYTITPVASNANYTITPENGTYTVTRHNVAVPTVTIYNNGATTDTTITAGTTEEKTFNGKAYSFNYTVDPTDANSIAKYTSAGGAAITNVGTSTLTLTVNSNYYWGDEGVAVGSQDTADKTFTIQVNKANITVTLHHDAIEYLDSVPTTGYSITAAPYLFNEDVSTVSINQGDFSTTYVVGNGVGTYNIAIANTNGSKTAIETYLSNYNVSYTGEDQLTVGKKTINVAADWIAWATGDSASMTYDKAAHGIVAVPANYTYAETAICNVAFSGGDSAEGAKQTHVNGNEAATTLTATFSLKTATNDGNGNLITDNYNLVTNSTSKDITITRKAVTITAADKSTTYGSAAPAFTSDAGSVLISGDTYTTEGSMTSAYTATAGNANRVVGTYDIVPAGWANNDYAISYVNGTLTVGKKVVTFTWSATQTWVYDAASHTITATVVGAEYGETITVATYSGDASATNVGNYSRTVTSLSDDDNYAITTAGTETETYSITKAPITITITAADSLVYTSAEKTVFTVTVSGMIGEETLTYTFDGTNIKEADGTFTLSNASETFTGMLAQSYGLSLTAVANGTGLVGNYDYTLPAAAENTIAKATFTPGAISYDGATVSWAAVTGTQGSDVITFTYTVNKGATEKQSSTSTMSYTASATGNDYVLAISFAGDRAANYNAIADQALLEVFSVTFTDTASEHTSEPMVFADVVYYAFSGESVAAHTAWSLQNYTWEGWKYGDPEDDYDAPALSASLTVRATWAIKTVTVTYKYKLEGTAASTYKTYKVETIYANADLTALPSVHWFSASAWNDAEALNGNTKTNVYYDTYAATRTFYTEFTFIVKNGDVDGNGSVTAADATLYRQVNVGGYAVDSYVLEDVAAAWAVVDTCTGEGTFADSWWAADKYFLQPVSDVDGDGEESANDIFYIANAQLDDSAYADIESGELVILLASEDYTIFEFLPAIPTSVTVAGASAEYSYASNKVTLNTALTSGQKLVIVVNGVKYVYTKA